MSQENSGNKPEGPSKTTNIYSLVDKIKDRKKTKEESARKERNPDLIDYSQFDSPKTNRRKALDTIVAEIIDMANKDARLKLSDTVVEIDKLEKNSSVDVLSVLEKSKHQNWLENLGYYYALAEKYLKEIDGTVRQIIDAPNPEPLNSNTTNTTGYRTHENNLGVHIDYTSIMKTERIIALLHSYSLKEWGADTIYLKALANEYIKRRKIKI